MVGLEYPESTVGGSNSWAIRTRKFDQYVLFDLLQGRRTGECSRIQHDGFRSRCRRTNSSLAYEDEREQAFILFMIDMAKVVVLPTVYGSQVAEMQSTAGDDDDEYIMHGLAGSVTNDLARRVLLTSLLELGVAGCHSQTEDAVVNTSSAI
jgi:hypothetical protein